MSQSTTTKPAPRKPPAQIPIKRDVHDTELIDETDELLDDIDALLENQEWMVGYLQKGGE